MTKSQTVALLLIASALAAVPAHAGPLDGYVAAQIGTTPAWWVELVALISAALGLVNALVKDSKLHPILRDILHLLSSSWGAGKNDPAAN